MPDITVAGTYTKDTAGFEFLSATGPLSGEPRKQILLFAGSTIGTTCTLNYVDDQGVSRTFQDGSITTLPRSVELGEIEVDLEIVVTGSPNFNVTSGIK